VLFRSLEDMNPYWNADRMLRGKLVAGIPAIAAERLVLQVESGAASEVTRIDPRSVGFQQFTKTPGGLRGTEASLREFGINTVPSTMKIEGVFDQKQRGKTSIV